MSQKETENSVFRVIFKIGFGIMTAMILQNPTSTFNSFWIESFDSWVCYFEDPWQQEKPELSFELALMLSLQWFFTWVSYLKKAWLISHWLHLLYIMWAWPLLWFFNPQKLICYQTFQKISFLRHNSAVNFDFWCLSCIRLAIL